MKRSTDADDVIVDQLKPHYLIICDGIFYLIPSDLVSADLLQKFEYASTCGDPDNNKFTWKGDVLFVDDTPEIKKTKKKLFKEGYITALEKEKKPDKQTTYAQTQLEADMNWEFFESAYLGLQEFKNFVVEESEIQNVFIRKYFSWQPYF